MLDDKTKFLNMGGVDLHENMAKNELVFVNKSSFFQWGCSSKQWQIVHNWPLLGSIRSLGGER